MTYPIRRKGKGKGKAKRIIKEPGRNKNQWYFMNSEDPCKEVYSMAERYMAQYLERKCSYCGGKIKNSAEYKYDKVTKALYHNICAEGLSNVNLAKGKGMAKRHMKYPAQLTKYFLFLYLTGSRLMEPILSKNLELEARNIKGNNYIYVKRINEKHHEANGDRQQIEVIIPICCESERRAWKYITGSNDIANTKEIFKFEEWGKLTPDKVSRYISNFKTDLKDTDGTPHKNCKITPHVLRHMRAFNLLVNHRVPDPMIISIMGWNDTQMLYYYAHIRRVLKMESMLKLAKDSGLLDKRFDLSQPSSPFSIVPIVPS